MEESHHAAFGDSIEVAGDVESPYEDEDTDWVGTVNHLQFPLYLESIYNFRISACHIIIVMLEPVVQVVTTVVQSRAVVCFGRTENC